MAHGSVIGQNSWGLRTRGGAGSRDLVSGWILVGESRCTLTGNGSVRHEHVWPRVVAHPYLGTAALL